MKKKIAIVCKIGNSLEFDDRIRKECIALMPSYECFIYVNYDDNRVEEGITSYGVPYKSLHLTLRDQLPSKKFFLPIKGLEFYLKVRPLLKDYDYIWCVEEFTTLLALFYKKNKCIWDLHEVPTMLTGSSLRRILFRQIEKKCYRLIHANDERLNYLKSLDMVRYPEKHYVIHNYPDTLFVESDKQSDKKDSINLWLEGKEYVYLQGLTAEERYPFNTIMALLTGTTFKILVVGGLKPTVLERLAQTYNGDLEKRLLSVGTIDSLEMPNLIRASSFSVVFYNYDDPNCKYCEANRFYNAITLGVPVLVGANDTMKKICEKYGVGVSLKKDGRDIDDVKSGIDVLLKEYANLKKNCLKYSVFFRWNNEDVLLVLKD